MNVILDTRVSPQMRAQLLVNRHGKLHNEQWREIVLEPLITILVLMVPTIILLRSFLLTLFVGGLWMVGVGALLAGRIRLVTRARRYARIPIFYGVFRATTKVPAKWMYWRSLMLIASDGKTIPFKRSLAPDRNFQPDQEYMVYYFKSVEGNVLLSFAPSDHLESATWRPASDFKTPFTQNS